MTQKTESILNVLKKEGAQNKNLNMIFGIIASISFILMFIPSLIVFVVIPWMISIVVLIVRGLYALDRKNCLKKSLKTMETTGSIKYADEILNKQYKTTKKECLSNHIYYVPGTFIMAYEDMLDIRKINSEYYFVTLDGKQHRVNGVKIEKDTINYILNSHNITSGAPYKSYKEKIDNFKKGIKQ